MQNQKGMLSPLVHFIYKAEAHSHMLLKLSQAAQNFLSQFWLLQGPEITEQEQEEAFYECSEGYDEHDMSDQLFQVFIKHYDSSNLYSYSFL